MLLIKNLAGTYIVEELFVSYSKDIYYCVDVILILIFKSELASV